MEAAHRSGMSVGQWLNQILAGNLDEDEADDEPAFNRIRRMGRRKPRRIDELNERLERLGPRRMMTAAPRLADQDNDNSPVLDLIESAVQAIERLEKRSVTGSAETPEGARAGADPLVETLRNFERKLDALSAPRPPAMPTGAVDPGVEARLSGILAMLDRLQPNNDPGLARSPAAAPMQAARGFPDEDPAFARALAEIEARRRNLDSDPEPGAPVERSSPVMAASQAQTSQAQASQALAANAHIDGMRQQLDLLVSRIDEMRSEARPESSRLQDRLNELASRIEEWGVQPQGDVATLRNDIAAIAASVELLSPKRLVGMVEDAVTTVAEKAFRAQRDGLPERLAEPLERMHEDVRAVLREVASSRGTDRLTQEVGNIARRLDLLSQGADPARLDDIARETEAIKSLVGQAMKAQPLEALARQIEALGRQIEKSQRSPLPGDDRQMLDAIREIGDRLARIDPAATFAGIETRLAAIGGIDDKLAEIARGMKKLAKDAQPLPQLDTIAERLERIDRVLDSTKGKPLAGLDTIAERLEKIGTSLDRVSTPSPAEGQDALVAMLERLSERMDQVQSASTEPAALDALQDEIARLAKRMEQGGGNAAGLDGIERSVGDLFTQLDQTRRDMRDAVESTATRAAQEAVKNAPRDDSSDTLAAEGLLLIKRDLNEFKTAQSEAERRTRGTLEALHGTLETLISRLGEMETREKPAAPMASRQVASSQASAPQASSEREPRLEPAAMPAMSAQRTPPPQTARVMPEAAMPEAASPGARAAAAPVDTMSDLPLEPGMQPGQGASLSAEASENTDPRSKFITAARHALQSASDRSQAALAEDKLVKNGKPARGAATTSFIVRARKPILLGLAAVVFSLGAMKVLTTRNQPATDMVLPPAQESPPSPRPQGQPGVQGLAPPAEQGEPREGPQTTGSAGTVAVPAEGQSMPTPQPNGIGMPSFGNPALNPLNSKRGQRLSETNAIAQTDPLSVGSIGPDGSARPIATGRVAINELITESNLKGQDKLREAALGGNPAALFEIGTRYADGRGVTRDPKLAARWFEQAAASGHGPSQYRLGSLYREGKGIAKDSTLAFQWFDRAAAQGHVLAMHNAAVLLAEGVHGAPDYAGAALWFKRAAEHGIKDSQFNVAILFARGLGVNQDLGESYRWFAIAALQGDQDAAKKRDDISARLTKDQLAKEADRVKGFKPNKANPVANEPGSWDKLAKQGS